MKVFVKIWLAFSSILGLLSPIALHAQADSIRTIQVANGQSYIIALVPSMEEVQVDFYYRVGSVFEHDTLSGVTLALSKVFDRQIRAAIQADPAIHIVYQSMVEPDQVRFHFEVVKNQFTRVLQIAKAILMHPHIDAQVVELAKGDIQSDLDINRQTPSHIDETRVMQQLWGSDYIKLNPYGDELHFMMLTPASLLKYHSKYFLPINSYVTVIGALDINETGKLMERTFADYNTLEFNPEYIVKVLDFKPKVNYTQLRAATHRSRPTATITYQNPGARQDRTSTYCAHILAELINDPNGRIQQQYATGDMNHLRATYTCGNYCGTFQLSIECAQHRYMDMYKVLEHIIQEITAHNYFKDGEIEVAGRNIGIRLREYKETSYPDYLRTVMRYRYINDETFFTSLPDSLYGIHPSAMTLYTDHYFSNVTGVRCLYTPTDTGAPVTPDQQYYPLDEHVTDMEWHYAQNQTKFTTDSDYIKLSHLVQWLQINPDILVQINGLADAKEYKEVHDDSILHFIQTDSTFHKAMPDRVEKSYLPTEAMRAVRIMKLLHEAGIPFDRISGTSMAFHSANATEAAAHRICTVTLEKIKPRLSLYEYHFGTKRSE